MMKAIFSTFQLTSDLKNLPVKNVVSFVLAQICIITRAAKYKKTRLMRVLLYLAEGVGFEPTLGLTLNTLSRRAP